MHEPSLKERVALIEERLGIDHAAIAADEAARLENGALAAPLSEPPAESEAEQEVEAA